MELITLRIRGHPVIGQASDPRRSRGLHRPKARTFGTCTRLGRDVALKRLPEGFSHDPDRIARFRREAQVLASLNQSNIGAIYGLEQSRGAQAIVLDFVEGETLAGREGRGLERALCELPESSNTAYRHRLSSHERHVG